MDRVRGNEAGPVAERLGHNVEARRVELGWSRRELAQRLTAAGRRFTLAAVQKLEANERRCDADDLVTVAHTLGVSVGDLLGAPKGTGATPTRVMLAIGRAEPALRIGLMNAIESGRFTSAELVDYVRHAVETWPLVIGDLRAFENWSSVLAAAPVEDAARMLADAGVDGITDPAELAHMFGDDVEKADQVLVAMRNLPNERGDHGDGK